MKNGGIYMFKFIEPKIQLDKNGKSLQISIYEL